MGQQVGRTECLRVLQEGHSVMPGFCSNCRYYEAVVARVVPVSRDLDALCDTCPKL
jgi:hypothetical protein